MLVIWNSCKSLLNVDRGTFTLKIFKALLFSLVLFFTPGVSVYSQITIVVDNLPAETPVADSLFITGDFNNWNPGDVRYALKRTSENHFTITLPKAIEKFEFKITRGSWKSVEGNLYGKAINNRVFTIPKKGVPATLHVQVAGWEDIPNIYNWNLHVVSLPSNTPAGSSVYVSGTFNEWSENDENFKLTQLEDGTYTVKIPKSDADTIWYKFHRGHWSTVESTLSGRFKENRASVWDRNQATNTIQCEIKGWADVRSGMNFLLHIILIACGFQSLWLVIMILSIRNRDHKKTRPLIFLLIITFIALTSSLAAYNIEQVKWLPKLLLLSNFTSVLYAPCLYYFIIAIGQIRKQPKHTHWFFLVAFAAFLVLYVPLLTLPRETFFLKLINREFEPTFIVGGILAYAFNIITWIVSLGLIRRENNSVSRHYYFPYAFPYLIMIIIHSSLCLLVWGFSLTVYIINFFSDHTSITLQSAQGSGFDVLWICFALSAFGHSLMVFHKRKLFIIKMDDPSEKHKIINPQTENISALKSELLLTMQKHQPYLNSKLSLQDLSDIMRINSHTLSWLINEGYHKNFFDFINEYRIEEFKSLVAQGLHKKQTVLSIAMQVGFSSKTTFNRAFKKYTGKTPREYFKNIPDSRLEDF